MFKLNFFILFLQFLSYKFTNSNSYNNREIFNNYIIKYNKNYASLNEYYYRYKVFNKKINRINYVNDNNYSYTLGINKFSDLTFDEFSYKYKGYNGLFYNNKYNNYHKLTLNNNNITQIDWRGEGLVTDIKDQQQCGSCWAFSEVGTMEGAKAKKTNKLVSMSEQDLLDCVPDCYGCNGGWPSLAIQYVINGSKTEGIDTEISYPYTAQDGTCNFTKNNIGGKFHDVIKIPEGNTKYLYDSILSVGPISVAIDAEEDFQSYKTGIFESYMCSNTSLDHAVLVVGYGITSKNKKYYIIKNSWGTDWGMDGYIYFSADIPNMCGIAQDACYAVY